MSLKIRKFSSWWYGVFKVKGQRTVVNLGVPITGKRPPKRTMLGDDEFERSRGRAMEAYRRLRRKTTESRTAEKELRKLVEIKTGKEAGFPKLAELTRLWLEIPRRKPPGPKYVIHCTAILNRFVAFAYGPALRSGMANFDGRYEYPPCGDDEYWCYNPNGTYLGRRLPCCSWPSLCPGLIRETRPEALQPSSQIVQPLDNIRNGLASAFHNLSNLIQP